MIGLAAAGVAEGAALEVGCVGWVEETSNGFARETGREPAAVVASMLSSFGSSPAGLAPNTFVGVLPCPNAGVEEEPNAGCPKPDEVDVVG